MRKLRVPVEHLLAVKEKTWLLLESHTKRTPAVGSV